VSNGTEGGGVSGINRSALNSSTFPPIKKNFLKGPGPLKNKKTNLSGLTTLHGALLDHGASGVENCIAERPMFKSAFPGAPHSAILATAE
jgi:hypothetical protein